MKFKEITITSDTFVCRNRKKNLARGQRGIVGFRRDETGVSTLEFCGAECLAEYRHKRASATERMLNRLSVQFN